MNFIRCNVDMEGVARFGPASISPSRPHEVSGDALLGIRPEHLALVDSGKGTFDAEVELVERLGAESLVYLRAPFLEKPITVRTGGALSLSERQSVGVQVDLTNLHVFSPASPSLSQEP